MEYSDLTVESLETNAPQLVGQLKALGAEEADTAAAKALEGKLNAARDDGAKLERERFASIIEQAKEYELSADSDAVQSIIAAGLTGDKAENAMLKAKLDTVKEQAPKSQGAQPDPEAAVAAGQAEAAEGLSASEAWDKNALLPSGARVQDDFGRKDDFERWAKNHPDAEGLFSADK